MIILRAHADALVDALRVIASPGGSAAAGLVEHHRTLAERALKAFASAETQAPTLHLLEAQHFSVPGLVQKIYADTASADIEAAELVNIMIKSLRMKCRATPATWRECLRAVQQARRALEGLDEKDDADCYVTLEPMILAGGGR